MLAFDDVQIVDVTGPAGVFGTATDVRRRLHRRDPAPYAVTLVTPTGGPARSSCGLTLAADLSLAQAARRDWDTVLVGGGDGVDRLLDNDDLRDGLRALAARSRRFGSICSGALLLADAGLLDGRRATTHWRRCGPMARRWPRVTVEPDRIWVRDGDIYTSAGVTAGMDLALALVEDDLGRDLALAVARVMVMFLKRPGGQAQFSAHLAAQTAETDALRAVQAWILDNLAAEISVDGLAARAGMSPRTFARAFARETGTTPARFVADARLDAARRLLEDTRLPVKTLAARCGFGGEERMRRTFHRTLGVSPETYRRRFAPAPSLQESTS
ncbi:MAG: DJ-1/PfpI family protein [Rhodobacterales bacterium]|nr:DJ-1/PfpI family protein [Rhodobacterales bacterium]